MEERIPSIFDADFPHVGKLRSISAPGDEDISSVNTDLITVIKKLQELRETEYYPSVAEEVKLLLRTLAQDLDSEIEVLALNIKGSYGCRSGIKAAVFRTVLELTYLLERIEEILALVDDEK